jgi:hypothetical protein
MSLVKLIQSCKPEFNNSLIEDMNLGNCRDKKAIISTICESYVKFWIEGVSGFEKTYSFSDFSDNSNLSLSRSGPCGIDMKTLSSSSLGEIDYLGINSGSALSVEVKSGKGKFSTIRKVNSYFDKKIDLTQLLIPENEFELVLFIPIQNLKQNDLKAFNFISNYEHSSGKKVNLVDLGNNDKNFEKLYQLYKLKYL